MVFEQEIYCFLIVIQNEILDVMEWIVYWQIVVFMVVLVIVFIVVYVVLGWIIVGFSKLVNVVCVFENKDYLVWVVILLCDEVGFVGLVFNWMVVEISYYMENFEKFVDECIVRLEIVNKEIVVLNQCLQDENLRFGVEFDVVKWIQEMVLLCCSELENIV